MHPTTIQTLLLANGWLEEQVDPFVAALFKDMPANRPLGLEAVLDMFLHLHLYGTMRPGEGV